MKKGKSYFYILMLLSFVLSACTPAAYDSGYPTEDTSQEELSLEAVDVSQFTEIGEVEDYLKDVNLKATKEDGTPYKLAWLNNDETDEQMAYMTQYMKKYAEEIGIELICFDGQSDPQKQIDQVNQSIIQKCDGIIICPIDSSALNIAMMKAKREGLVVINSMMIISDEEYFDNYVGPSDTMVGQQAASMLIDALPEGGKVALIEGAMGAAAQVNRNLGFTSVLKNYPQYELVETQTANWTTVEAMNVMESYLAKYKDLKGVFCENDAEALGALQAIEKSGRDDVVVIGCDGMQSVINKIGEGSKIYGTSLTPVSLISEVQIMAAIAHLNGDGDKLDKIIYTNNVCVLNENADQLESGWGGE